MFENTYKEPEQVVPQNPVKKSRSLFGWLEYVLHQPFLRQSKPSVYIFRLVFVMGLAIIYIGNTHYAYRTQRKIISLEKEVSNIKADYITIQSKLMNSSRESEVEKRAILLDLKPNQKVLPQISIEQ